MADELPDATRPDVTRPDVTQWHERTVERSLRAARERAISRGDKFISAAGELLRTTGKTDFTVQQVVDRSGMSLRSFYHHFATKDDLLLALIEETVHRYLADLRPRIAEEPDPVEQLRMVLLTSFRNPESGDPANRGLVLFHWHLAESRTEEFIATLSPQVDLIAEVLEAGVARGRFRTDIGVKALATMVTNMLISLLDMRILGVDLTDEPVTAEDVVRWCLAAVAPQPG